MRTSGTYCLRKPKKSLRLNAAFICMRLRGGFIFGFVFKNVMAPKINGFPEVTMPQNCAYFTV